MSFDVVQIIPSPKSKDVRTDFPPIAFRSARQDPVTDAAPDKRARLVGWAA